MLPWKKLAKRYRAQITQVKLDEKRRSIADRPWMRKCLKDDCDCWLGPTTQSGLPRYCPDHNDLNP
jgi:hypothetical protein